MIVLEMVFLAGVATLAIGGWKLVACLGQQLAQRMGLTAAVQNVSDLQLQIIKLREEKIKLEQHIVQLQKRLQGRDCRMPSIVVYVTPSGKCYHTHSECGHLKDRESKELRMCAHCSKTSSKLSE